MSSKKVYKKEFEELLRTEEQVRDIYGYYIKRIEDPFLSEKLSWIYEQEKEHVEIAQGFIDMISQ